MKYNDLYTFPENHSPSPYESPVRVYRFGNAYLPKGLLLRVVGWIEDPGFPTGQVPEDCIDLLAAAHPQKILFDDTRGIHTCTFCNKSTPTVKWKGRSILLKGYGHCLVQKGDVVYLAPELLLHYILDHKYCPPEEFVQAVLHGKFLEEDDLVIEWEKRNS